jgi:gamma-glutamyltranspeptidase/glutathione hydrolase
MQNKWKAFRFLIILILSIYAFSGAAADNDAVKGKNGMVVSVDEYASRVGIEILKNGGNAVDAAVAVGFALAATYPAAGNIGGGGFMIIRFPDTKEAVALDFREMAPGLATADMYLDTEGKHVKRKSLYGNMEP